MTKENFPWLLHLLCMFVLIPPYLTEQDGQFKGNRYYKTSVSFDFYSGRAHWNVLFWVWNTMQLIGLLLVCFYLVLYFPESILNLLMPLPFSIKWTQVNVCSSFFFTTIVSFAARFAWALEYHFMLLMRVHPSSFALYNIEVLFKKYVITYDTGLRQRIEYKEYKVVFNWNKRQCI